MSVVNDSFDRCYGLFAGSSLSAPVRDALPETGGRVLNLGSGVKPYCSTKNVEVVNMDNDMDPRRKEGNYQIDVEGSALDRYPFPDGHFDHVMGEQLPSLIGWKPQLINEAARVLKPGGTLHLHSNTTIYDKKEVHESLTKAGFENIQVLSNGNAIKATKQRYNIGGWEVIAQQLGIDR